MPTATITFLFTDIEGSTRLWDQHPDEMREALASHDSLIRREVESAGGAVFKTVGDAFYAAFDAAPGAVHAALAIQVALSDRRATSGMLLRVRIAIHSGTVQVRDNDYFGGPLNRISRMLGAGYGGQILLSSVAHELVRELLPPAVTVRDLGSHRLRDLGRPEQIFQLVHPGLPSEFPGLKTLNDPGMPNNLPQQVTSFVGREAELAAVKALLSEHRLVTLTGTGGCGKSRLSLEVAADIIDRFPDGVWFVELAPISDPALVTQVVAMTLGQREEPGRPILETLVANLQLKNLLVILDNCEHLIDACAELAAALLRRCPDVRICASSRQALGIAGEQAFRMPSLSLPTEREPASLEKITTYESVRLFIERATAIDARFSVTNANAPALAQICQQVDGIPLALELAAARVRSLSLEEINIRLDNMFRLLTGGSRTALPRQQTLRALIDWSYNLLSEPERALLCRLSIFTGGWRLASAEVICADELVDEFDILDLLTALVDKSLVHPEVSGQEMRYRLLETVRHYARERLAKGGETETFRARHQEWFLSFAEEAEPHLIGPEQAQWLDRLQADHDNLRTAMEAPDRLAALRVAAALWRFWDVRGYLSEGCERLAALLDAAGDQAPPALRARAIRGAGRLTYSQGEMTGAQRWYRDCMEIYRAIGDREGVAQCLNDLGSATISEGEIAAAARYFKESLAIRRELGNRRGIAYALRGLADVLRVQGDRPAAKSMLAECLEILREIGDKQGIAYTLLAAIQQSHHDMQAARMAYDECLAIMRDIGDHRGVGWTLYHFGAILVANEQLDEGETELHESLILLREVGDRHGAAAALLQLGSAACLRQEYATARPILEESLTLLRDVGDREMTIATLDRLAGALEALGETDLAAGYRAEAESLANSTNQEQPQS